VRAEVLLAGGRLAEAAEVTDAVGGGTTSEVLWFAKARLHWYLGRWHDALAACRRVIAMQAHDPSLHTAWTLSLAGLLETLTGDVATGRAFVSHAERLYGDRDFYDFSAWNDWSAGVALWWTGDNEAARRRAASAMRRAETLRSPTTIVRFVADVVEISADAGDDDEAARWARLASDAHSHDPFTQAQVAYANAIVRPSAEGFAAAAEAATDLPFLRARALEHLAELSSGGARRDALAEVIRLAADLPVPALEARATTALRSEGGPGRRAAQHVGHLTARERQVALLAQRGATTKGIAERLHLSERTVESHLAHVYSKLGVSGRKELASLDEL
jgi:ATP/maltotriose-dependent transcriptional regulator MalT